MTYLGFLLVFLLTPIALLCTYHIVKDEGNISYDSYKWIVGISLIAFVYTTPWDNYLVYKSVWYYGADRVLGTIGYVPIEEYLFFLLQPLLTGAFLLMLLRRSRLVSHTDDMGKTRHVRPFMLAVWAACFLVGVALLYFSRSQPHFTYLGLILAWASPVLIGMAWLSADTFYAYRRAWALGITIPTVYLWIADRVAIGAGIWDISDTYSLDWDPLGLPIEEAVFFLLTNVLVVQGLLMLLPKKQDGYFAITGA